jgi:hypothetical protein
MLATHPRHIDFLRRTVSVVETLVELSMSVANPAATPSAKDGSGARREVGTPESGDLRHLPAARLRKILLSLDKPGVGEKVLRAPFDAELPRCSG